MKLRPLSQFAIRSILLAIVLTLGLLYHFVEGLIHNPKKEALEIANKVMASLLAQNEEDGTKALLAEYSQSRQGMAIIYGQYEVYPGFLLYTQEPRIRIFVTVYAHDPSVPREVVAEVIKDVDRRGEVIFTPNSGIEKPEKP